jgi:predicted urease superfamily metal-dependent hydrolase
MIYVARVQYLGPKTVPKTNASNYLDAGLDEKYLWKAHQELAEELYGPSIS